LEKMLARRLTGEPLEWIVGSVEFCGLRLRVDPGVYVPRPQSELVARRAAARLPPDGVAVDLCTGSGAIAAVLMRERPGARVVASDLDERAVVCARENGVEAYAGDLFAPLAIEAADVVTAVVPYVPTTELPLLQRDALTFESALCYDGGVDGLDVVRRVVAGAADVLRPGGALLVELGGRQPDVVRIDLAGRGFAEIAELRDEDGEVRGLEAVRGPR
jgi:release factor glutamine methyltransferase